MFEARMSSIETHTVPDWYSNAKLGIFIHWGIYSVPAWAEPSAQLGEIELDERWYAHNPYAEWYLNSLRIGHGPTYDHHVQTYGTDFNYEDFIPQWRAEHFDPKRWAELFKEAGAKYVVLTTKHHDGFCLWDSEYTDYNAAKMGPHRDLLSDLSAAVKEEGIKMGVYYSGIIDWRFSKRPMVSQFDVDTPDNISYAYSDYAYNQVIELIDKVKPAVLWNDIGWPEKGLSDLPHLFSIYYNTVPEGVVNDRWSGVWHDYTCKEYKMGEKQLNHKWEMTRGLGLSFGYNQNETEKQVISLVDLIELLIDTVAFNGNLLLNIGPKADGTLDFLQEKRLHELGAWLKENGESIFDTTPYSTQKIEKEEATFYFTQNEENVYLFVTHFKDYVIPLVEGEWIPITQGVELIRENQQLTLKIDSLERTAVVLKLKK